MGESVVPCLQESVSFGRFEHDSLCWERWSTFPTNKYLEEVEKCSTPGSVAQKKAYFEAHYKRVAARKAELLDLEKKRESELMSSEDRSQTSVGSACNTSEEEFDVVKSNSHNPASGPELEDEEEEFTREVIDAHNHVLDYGEAEVFDDRDEVVNFTSDFSELIDEELNDGVDITNENTDLQPEVEEVSGDLCPQMESPPEPEELVFVEEEFSSTTELQDMEELARDKDTEIADREAEHVAELDGVGTMQEELDQDKVEEREISEPQAENVKKLDNSKTTSKESPETKGEEREVAKKETEDPVKSENPRKMQKELPQDESEERKGIKRETKAPVKFGNPKKMQKEVAVKRTTNATTINSNKRPESPMAKKSLPGPKSPMLSTPKSSKPVLSKSAMSTTRPTVKKENGSTPLTTKKATRPETKRVLPTSLHMSFSLGPANSDPSAPVTTRKSLIMEKMGDKEIVKRAFKAFRNFNPLSSSSLTKAPATNQLGNKKIEKGSALDTSEKKHEGISRPIRPSSPVPRHVGIKKIADSPGLHKTIGVDQRNGKSIPASFDSKSQDKGHKQKEVSKNIEKKSKTKEAGKAHLQSQSKVKLEKPTVKTPSQDVTSKAKLSASYNQGHGFLRGLRKNDAKTQASGR